jgi:hypothetical protein
MTLQPVSGEMNFNHTHNFSKESAKSRSSYQPFTELPSDPVISELSRQYGKPPSSKSREKLP